MNSLLDNVLNSIKTFKTGFDDIDEYLHGGLKTKSVISMCSRDQNYTFLCSMISKLTENQIKTIYFENHSSTIPIKIISKILDISENSFNNGSFSAKERMNIVEKKGDLNKLLFHKILKKSSFDFKNLYLEQESLNFEVVIINTDIFQSYSRPDMSKVLFQLRDFINDTNSIVILLDNFNKEVDINIQQYSDIVFIDGKNELTISKCRTGQPNTSFNL